MFGLWTFGKPENLVIGTLLGLTQLKVLLSSFLWPFRKFISFLPIFSIVVVFMGSLSKIKVFVS